jgi:hypothetical protein
MERCEHSLVLTAHTHALSEATADAGDAYTGVFGGGPIPATPQIKRPRG